jgi:hypothetical protein
MLNTKQCIDTPGDVKAVLSWRADTGLVSAFDPASKRTRNWLHPRASPRPAPPPRRLVPSPSREATRGRGRGPRRAPPPPRVGEVLGKLPPGAKWRPRPLHHCKDGRDQRPSALIGRFFGLRAALLAVSKEGSGRETRWSRAPTIPGGTCGVRDEQRRWQSGVVESFASPAAKWRPCDRASRSLASACATDRSRAGESVPPGEG